MNDAERNINNAPRGTEEHMEKFLKGLDLVTILAAVVGIIAGIVTKDGTWFHLAWGLLIPAGRRTARVLPVLAVVAVVAGCSGASAFGPLMDPQGIADAAGIAASCVGQESATLAPAFDVDWSANQVTYGGGIFVGCGSLLARVKCYQEKPLPGEKPKWKCDPISTWAKQP